MNEDNPYSLFLMNCNHCNKPKIEMARWIVFGRRDKHSYKCQWCEKETLSSWVFTDHAMLLHVNKMWFEKTGIKTLEG